MFVLRRRSVALALGLLAGCSPPASSPAPRRGTEELSVHDDECDEEPAFPGRSCGAIGASRPAGSSGARAAESGAPAASGPAGSGGPAGSAAGGGEPCGICASYGEPTLAGRVRRRSIVELSGLVASRRSPGVLFGHNDSGDVARFFAMRQDGAVLGQFTLAGAAAIDWEDIALGPCAAGSCVFLADIGDNKHNRPFCTIYVAPEPAVEGEDPARKTAVSFEERRFRYPDGPHNAETVLVHPVSGQVYVITKEKSGKSVVFRLPAPSAGVAVVAEKVVDLTVPPGGNLEITGGDIHPCASPPRVLLRTYDRAFELDAPVDGPFEAVFSATPRLVPAPSRKQETQGESITYLPDGRGYLTSTEGKSPPIHRVDCR